jgi:hypothetical protein
MPVTIDKLLGKPLLHTHQLSDIATTNSGSIDNTSTVTVTTNTTLGDYTTVLADATSGNITLTLPAAASNVNKFFRIKKIDSSANTITVDGNASETIDGDTTMIISFQWSAMDIVSNGTGWYII